MSEHYFSGSRKAEMNKMMKRREERFKNIIYAFSAICVFISLTGFLVSTIIYAADREIHIFNLEKYIERSKQAEIKCGCGNYTLTETEIICDGVK